MQSLSQNRPVNKDSKIRTYSPILDPSSIIRMRSRLQDADYLTFDQRRPIILPKNHIVTQLIEWHYHEDLLHQNQATVLNEIKQRFAISSLRSALKSLRARCWQCKRRNMKPDILEMSDFSPSRLAARMSPFAYTGLDYFRSIMVKQGRLLKKLMCALFTCLTTRAIHIELASSLSTDSFWC